MRAILLILIVLVVAAILAIGTGFLDINTIRGVKAPDVDASSNGISASGGQAPAFDIETGTVTLGTQQTTVPLPTVDVNPANGQQAQPQNPQQPAQARPTQQQQPNVVSGNSTQ